MKAKSGAKTVCFQRHKCQQPCFVDSSVVHLLHPPAALGERDHVTGFDVLSDAINAGRKRCEDVAVNSVWICSPYLTGEAFTWLKQYFRKEKPGTLYLITRAEHDPFEVTPKGWMGCHFKRFIEDFCDNTNAVAYSCIYNSSNGKEPLMHAKLYLDGCFKDGDPGGDLSWDKNIKKKKKANSFEPFSAFFGSMNFTNTGLGVNGSGKRRPDAQHFELLAEAQGENAKAGLKKTFRYLWNRGGRARYKYDPSKQWARWRKSNKKPDGYWLPLDMKLLRNFSSLCEQLKLRHRQRLLSFYDL